MPTQTFPCPFCGKKMGVGIELLGKKVRCPNPTCSQVLVAPTPAVASAAPVVIPLPPPIPAPPPEPPGDIPVFNLPSQEARESIFGEQEDESDDVFSSSGGSKLQMPEVPPPEPAVEPLPAPAMPVPSVSTTEAEPNYAKTVELTSPFAGFAAPAMPPEPVPAPRVVAVPVPVPVMPIPTVAPIGATPPSSPGTNPWAGMDEVVAAPALLPVLVPIPVEAQFTEAAEEPKPRKKRRDDSGEDRPAKRTPASSGGSPLFKIGFFLLAPYALVITGLAVYGLFFKSSTPPGHPLATIPDNFGEFTPAERKKTGKLTVPVDGALPPELRVAMGSKLEVGQLEIEPLGLEQRNLKIVTQSKSEKVVQSGNVPAIVLKLRIKNTSDDLLIHPLDPAFNRRIVGTERIGTWLVVGKQTFWGGAIGWPFPSNVSRVYESAQEADATPLKPGESREFVIFTDANPRVAPAIKVAKETLLWRVQVRRGRIDFDGKDVPVTAIIGVEFKPSDVKEPD